MGGERPLAGHNRPDDETEAYKKIANWRGASTAWTMVQREESRRFRSASV